MQRHWRVKNLAIQPWLTMWHSERYGYFIFLFLEHIYNVMFLTFSLLIAILFYQKRSSLPRLISVFYAVSCAAVLLDTFVAVQMAPATEIPYREVFRSIFTVVVWIPYFNVSVRVKETFVHRKNPDDDGDGNFIKHKNRTRINYRSQMLTPAKWVSVTSFDKICLGLDICSCFL